MNTTTSVTQLWVEVPLYGGVLPSYEGGGSEPNTLEPTGLDVFSTDELVLFN